PNVAGYGLLSGRCWLRSCCVRRASIALRPVMTSLTKSRLRVWSSFMGASHAEVREDGARDYAAGGDLRLPARSALVARARTLVQGDTLGSVRGDVSPPAAARVNTGLDTGRGSRPLLSGVLLLIVADGLFQHLLPTTP